MTSRLCIHCQAPIARHRGESRPRFAARRFCGNVCASAATSTIHQTKACVQCGGTMTKKAGMGAANWARRKYCSGACSIEASRKLAAEKPAKPIPPKRVRVSRVGSRRVVVPIEVPRTVQPAPEPETAIDRSLVTDIAAFANHWRGCRWIPGHYRWGDPDPYCGCRLDPRSAIYCAEHRALATTKAVQSTRLITVPADAVKQRGDGVSRVFA